MKATSSAIVTDTTQGDFTTHSTKGQILDHTVLRNWEKKNQCNYSEKNDFCYKCISGGVPSLNCMGRARLYAGISVIIMSANSYGHDEECGYISFSPLTDLALWACCRVESSSLCPAGTVAPRPQPLAPLWRLTQNPEWQKRKKRSVTPLIINKASLITQGTNTKPSVFIG